jgi:hypothetical protein
MSDEENDPTIIKRKKKRAAPKEQVAGHQTLTPTNFDGPPRPFHKPINKGSVRPFGPRSR